MLALVGLINFLDDKLKIKNVRFICIVFSLIILVTFVYFYPIVSGYKISTEYRDETKWFKSWIY